MSKEHIESYTQYIKRSPHWQDLRARKLEVARACENCGSSDRLHVHHIRYRMFYDCEPSDLMVLCEKCHSAFHLVKECVSCWQIDNAEDTCGLIRYFLSLPAEERAALKKERRVKREEERHKTRQGRKRFRLRVLELLADFKHARVDAAAVKILIEDLKRLIQ